MNDNNNIYVSVCVLTYKPKIEFIKSLQILLKQNININDLIIINTEEESLFINYDDENKKLLQELLSKDFIKIIHIKKTEFDHGRTRNIVIENLNLSNDFDKKYILYMTDDAIPYDSYLLDNMIKSFDDNTALVYAKQIPNDKCKYTEKLVRNFNYPDFDIIKNKNTLAKYGIKNYFSSNVCCMYDLEIFIKLNKFDENLPLNEDMFYSIKAIDEGFDIKYSANSKVIHSHNFNYIQQYKRNYLIGQTHSINKNKLSSIKSEKEGFKLIKYVLINCIKSFRIIEAIDFIINCIFRYIGFILGKKSIKGKIC